MRAIIDPIDKEFRECLGESGACSPSLEDQKTELMFLGGDQSSS
jgi:hypothetical protein